ncbi:MAG: 1,4-alpha-glucan branching protein GlgB [Pseudomonadota bacterium]
MAEPRGADPLLPQAAEALVSGRHADPFAILGPHRAHGGGTAQEAAGAATVIRVFKPHAEHVALVDMHDAPIASMARIHPDGLFSILVDGEAPPYRLSVTAGGTTCIEDDPYRFGPLLGDLDIHLIGEGAHKRLYERLGAHPIRMEGVEGVGFAVWAPNARRVSVVGDFNGWDGRRHPMRLRIEVGVWEIFIPHVAAGTPYKFELIGPHGQLLPLRSDPFAFAAEEPPRTAAKVHGLPTHTFRDGPFVDARARANDRKSPISIYEVHLGSWRRKDGNTLLDYDELAQTLIPYAKDMGFTHIELMPVSEHPFDGSWGYQPVGLYAPTSRFGSPEGFARLVDAAHGAGLGIIIDWVPAHFPTDAHGLGRFDGTHLYEHQDPKEGFHLDWNTLIYNLGRKEVANFLLANALFWLKNYHVDGLRVDAVASMLYRDYSRQDGEWVPNIYGGRENLESIAFFRTLSQHIWEDCPGVMTAAEESTAFPNVSRPVEEGGLGFDYKWNMGWMHDTLRYMSKDPVHRRHHHNDLTFGLLYAFSESFILPLSHDEVVHGKGSLIAKMPGDAWQRFANLRAYFAFMWTHPGKKLLFMGGEFAQLREWTHEQSLDWHLLADGAHKGIQDLVRDLNSLYCSTPALHEQDCVPQGFQWIDASHAEASIFIFARYAEDGSPAVTILNFTPVVRGNYKIGLPRGGRWREAINTDGRHYGGSGVDNGGVVAASDEGYHGQPHSISLTLPPLAALVLVPD